MRHTTYDKEAVIADIAARKIKPAAIAEKYGITVGNVYTIKAAAKRAGMIDARGLVPISERSRGEDSVLTPALRERIKDMRADESHAYTTSEITIILYKEGYIDISRSDVEKVMARSSAPRGMHLNSGDKSVDSV